MNIYSRKQAGNIYDTEFHKTRNNNGKSCTLVIYNQAIRDDSNHTRWLYD